MQITAVLLAAGRGERMGGDRNKLLLPVEGRPLIAYSIDAFAASPMIDELVVVVRPADAAAIEPLLPACPPARLVPGGARRRDSALAGTAAARGEIVLIHDAARPLPSDRLIERVIAAAVETGAAVPVLPVTDTIRGVDDGARLLPEAVDRHRLRRMQTPQGFRRELVHRALLTAEASVTDDAAAVLAAGHPVIAVAGDPANLKVTTPEDLVFLRALLRAPRRAGSAPGPSVAAPEESG